MTPTCAYCGCWIATTAETVGTPPGPVRHLPCECRWRGEQIERLTRECEAANAAGRALTADLAASQGYAEGLRRENVRLRALLRRWRDGWVQADADGFSPSCDLQDSTDAALEGRDDRDQ